jgi:ribonuclease HI
MKIEIYCAGLCRDEGESQLGGCGIVLVSSDEYGRSQYRELSFGLGGSSQILSDIQACRLGLSAIIPSVRSSQVTMFVENHDIATILTSNITMVGFKDQILDLHRWRSYYKNFTVHMCAGPHRMFDRVKDLAKQALITQKNTDSLTIVQNGVARNAKRKS